MPEETVMHEAKPPKTIQPDSNKQLLFVSLAGTFVVFYLIVVLVVVISSYTKNRELTLLRNNLTSLNTKYSQLETQLSSEKQAKNEFERALDTVQRSPKIIKYGTVRGGSNDTNIFRLAELITPSTDIFFSKLILQSNSGAGEFIIATLYALADPTDLDKAVKIAEAKVQATILRGTVSEGKEFVIDFKQNVELFADNNYLLTISASNSQTQAGVAYTSDDTFDDGVLYVFSTDGETPGWTQKVAQDLYFRLE